MQAETLRVVLRDVTGQAKYVYSQAITSQMCVNSPRIRVANLTCEEVSVVVVVIVFRSFLFFETQGRYFVSSGRLDDNWWHLTFDTLARRFFSRMFVAKNTWETYDIHRVLETNSFAQSVWIIYFSFYFSAMLRVKSTVIRELYMENCKDLSEKRDIDARLNNSVK